jgi:hypothetical protein
MLMKKTALAPALIALSVAVTSLAVFAGPSGDGHHGGHHGGSDGKNGNDNGDGKNGGGGGDGKNGGGEGKNGGGGGGGTAGGAEGDRCDAYRNFMYYRHCLLKERRRFVRIRMVPCMQGDAIVYDYGCGQRVVYVPQRRRIVYVQQPAPDYYVQGPAPYVQEQVVIRSSYRKLSKRQRLKLRRQQIVVADTGAYRDYGYDSGYSYNYGGMSRAARMQQERRLRKRMAMQHDYSYGYGNGYGYDDGYGYAQPRVYHRKKKRRAMMMDYGAAYDPGITIHYGPTILKNGAY